VTRYNGRESAFPDGVVLKDVISDGHFALAEQIRAAESRGDAFDPRTHFAEAIRRIDIKVPVPNLAGSSTVLVDTPGLYSRMNFGYDVLTREFRDSAACAVFVVKTDNLFLEQVFAEFNQLLDLFSRIFLVINVDSSKRDLQPDGSLQPSAESQRPEQIIEAFTTLSMAGPLRRAYEEGRVRIHAIDLLNAASGFLKKTEPPAAGEDTTIAASGAHGANGAEKSHHGFDAFVADLTDYLNSSDYTREFIRDSLRQGNTLCEEARASVEGELIGQLREQQDALAGQMRQLDEQITAADRLLKADWQAAFDKVRAAHTQAADASLTARTAQLRKDLRDSLDRWLVGNDSIKSLQDDVWNPLLVETGQTLAEESRNRLRELLATSHGGAEPAAAVMSDLHTVNFQFTPVAHSAWSSLDEPDANGSYRTQIPLAEIPVRKTFVDWLLFRRKTTVRRRLFGEDGAQAIAPEEKQKRLREPSRAAFEQIVDRTVSERFPALPHKFGDRLLSSYAQRFRASLLTALQQQRDEFAQARAAKQQPFDRNVQLLAALEELQQRTDKVASDLAQIAEGENAPPDALPQITEETAAMPKPEALPSP
jgi:hypothetical protein